MTVIYDHDLKIAGLSLIPLSRSGPQQWFHNYKIISLENWDEGQKADVISVWDKNTFPVHRLKSLLDSNKFRELLLSQFMDYDLFIGKPQRIPRWLIPHQLLMLDNRLARQIENKVFVREIFADDLPFPQYEIHSLDSLRSSAFEKIMNGRSTVVVQAENSSSSKGTFVVSSKVTFQNVVKHLKRLSCARVVVSSFINNAEEFSMQACVTRYGVILGPLQRQLLSNPILCNPDLRGTEKFCGGLIDRDDQNSEVAITCRALTDSVGRSLRKMGYQGIYGIDFLYDHSKLYTLEINARPTGLTPLLTGVNVPLLLLHMLELGKYEYKINGKDYDLNESAGLFILHSKSGLKRKLCATPPSGTYKLDGENLQMKSLSTNLYELNEQEFVLENYCLPGGTVLPGGRLVRLMFKGKTIDKSEKVLYNEIQQTIRTVEKNIILE
ncbi:MAG TPA: ATP-grasp domain-containing protein [Candidatus Saccharimonadales bacterium]|nr:ATP-grasp domain-containing protein [Candidatus Saccharimonadales bacterium]